MDSLRPHLFCRSSSCDLLPASKGFVSQNTRRWRPVSFATLYNLMKTVHPTSTEWLTIETIDNRVVNYREHSNFDSTLLISLYTNLPTLYFFILGLLPCNLPWQIASLGGALSLPEELFSLVLILPSYPFLPHLPCFILTKCVVLKQPAVITVCPCKRSLQYTLSLPLQHPATPPSHVGLASPCAA